jgi:ABC-type Fe3+/spermidine/putrescine transport system ATPase subunit
MSSISLDNVVKAFAGRTAVDSLSLRIERGERLVLWGPSGCGKTTVLRLIAGLELPDLGAIQIDGRTVAQAGRIIVPPEQRGIGMVFQDLALWPHMTVRDNLLFGLRSRRVSVADSEGRVKDLLKRVNLEPREGAKPHELSGGEQQRVALARALVLQPSILLMDEPLSSLDEDLKQQIIKDVLKLQNDVAFTLIYVTHDRSEAEAVASRICKMVEGRVKSQ